MKPLKTLDLVLKREWYDLIEQGIKKEEYREIKPYWCKRLKGFARVCPYSLPSSTEKRMCQMSGTYCPSDFEPVYDKIRFRRGYTKKSMTYEILNMRIGNGNPEWGAPKDKMVFILTLGEKVD